MKLNAYYCQTTTYYGGIKASISNYMHFYEEYNN